MSDAGVVEEWVYQGGTFTSTNSWMQGGSSSGGNMILGWNTDVATTRKQIPSKLRKSLLQISYKNADGNTINEQYIGTSFTDTEWSKDENWTKIPSKSDLLEITTQRYAGVSLGKNLFDKSKATKGYYLNGLNSFGTNSLYAYTDYINVSSRNSKQCKLRI